MNERVKLILKTKNISASKFADEIGVQRSSISHIISGRNNPSLDFIQKIMKRFPDISSDWLMFGKGTMYKDHDLFSTLEETKTEKAKLADDIFQGEDDMVDENGNGAIDNQSYNNENEKSNNSDVPIDILKKIKTPNEATRDVKKTTIDAKITSRKIERIIIFYSDKTYTDYRPE